jgi:hypothetical protein
MSPESIDHPAHYGGADNPYEVIKVIDAWGLGFCRGSALKYLYRAGKKDPALLLEDLGKAAWCLRYRAEHASALFAGGSIPQEYMPGLVLKAWGVAPFSPLGLAIESIAYNWSEQALGFVETHIEEVSP